jgi:hypothetical protein
VGVNFSEKYSHYLEKVIPETVHSNVDMYILLLTLGDTSAILVEGSDNRIGLTWI